MSKNSRIWLLPGYYKFKGGRGSFTIGALCYKRQTTADKWIITNICDGTQYTRESNSSFRFRTGTGFAESLRFRCTRYKPIWQPVPPDQYHSLRQWQNPMIVKFIVSKDEFYICWLHEDIPAWVGLSGNIQLTTNGAFWTARWLDDRGDISRYEQSVKVEIWNI